MISVVVLSYSRSAVAAAVVGAAVPLAFGRTRLRSVVTLGLGAVGAAIVCGWALHDHNLTADGVAQGARASAGHALGIVLLVVLIGVGVAGAWVGARVDRTRLPEDTRLQNRQGSVVPGRADSRAHRDRSGGLLAWVHGPDLAHLEQPDQHHHRRRRHPQPACGAVEQPSRLLARGDLGRQPPPARRRGRGWLHGGALALPDSRARDRRPRPQLHLPDLRGLRADRNRPQPRPADRVAAVGRGDARARWGRPAGAAIRRTHVVRDRRRRARRMGSRRWRPIARPNATQSGRCSASSPRSRSVRRSTGPGSPQEWRCRRSPAAGWIAGRGPLVTARRDDDRTRTEP